MILIDIDYFCLSLDNEFDRQIKEDFFIKGSHNNKSYLVDKRLLEVLENLHNKIKFKLVSLSKKQNKINAIKNTLSLKENLFHFEDIEID